MKGSQVHVWRPSDPLTSHRINKNNISLIRLVRYAFQLLWVCEQNCLLTWCFEPPRLEQGFGSLQGNSSEKTRIKRTCKNVFYKALLGKKKQYNHLPCSCFEGMRPARSLPCFRQQACHQVLSFMLTTWRMSPLLKATAASLHGMAGSSTGS